MFFSSLMRVAALSASRTVCLMAVLLMFFSAGVAAESSKARVIVIDIDQAKRLYDLGAVFIDVRDDEQWRIGHIKDARHVNFRKNFARLKTLDGIDKDTALVFYCSSAECEIGPYAAAVSMEWGFKNVLYFQDGYFAWMLEDYPIKMTSGLRTYTGTIQIRRAPPSSMPQAPAAKH